MLLIQRKEMERFQAYLQERESSGTAVAKYIHDIGVLASFCGGQIMGKGMLIAFKNGVLASFCGGQIMGKGMLIAFKNQAKDYAAASINSMLAAVNRFLDSTILPDFLRGSCVA